MTHFGQGPWGGGFAAENEQSRVTDDWPIFLDDINWVAPTHSSRVTLSADGFPFGSAAITHWSKAVRGETWAMYINSISGQSSQLSGDDGDRDGLRNVGLLSTIDTACCLRRICWVQSSWKFYVYVRPVVCESAVFPVPCMQVWKSHCSSCHCYFVLRRAQPLARS